MSRRKVLFIQATNAAAYPPLLHAGAIFAEEGWRVTFLSAPRLGADLDYPPDANFEVISEPLRATHAWPKPAYARYCWQAMVLARKVGPDLIYASDPIGALPGLLAARVAGAKLIYHEHDSPSDPAQLNPLVRLARRRAARAALRVVFPNAGRANLCAQELGCSADRVAVVWNVPRREEVTPSPGPAGKQRFMLHYQGSITPARLPVAVAEAVAMFAGQVILRIVGYESPSATGYVRHLTEKLGAADSGGLLDYAGIADRADVVRIASTADAGLMVVPPQSPDINFAHMAGASNKAFEYMAAGLPLIVSDLPEWQDMFVKPGHALAVRPADPASIAEAIGRLIATPHLRAEIGRRNRERIIAEWNYETCFAPVLQAASGRPESAATQRHGEQVS
jgi:glycosyltransferase involved in cell wall biosynthesis